MANDAGGHRRAVTRADVARYAQVSSAVVSYVVNDGPKRVAPATAARVREAIEVLGYRPNISARSLKRGTTEMLGLVLPDLGNPFFAEFAHEIELAAAREGYALVVGASGGDPDLESRLINDLAARRVDGLLIATVRTLWEVASLGHPGAPTVLFDCQYDAPGYATIGPNAFEGARRAVEHLLKVHGNGSVALVIGESREEQKPTARERGWLEAHGAVGRSPGPIGRGLFDRRNGYEIGRKLLGERNRPTAIFASSDQMAVGVLRAIRELGLTVPEDVALVSFDGTSESEYCWPPLTVARQPVLEMATAAIQRVLDPRRPLRHELFEIELVIRHSCGC